MKPHYRLMKLSQCPNGTRFYFYRLKQLLPFTLIANSFKKHESIYHEGHDFNMTARKYRTSIHKLVWAKVN